MSIQRYGLALETVHIEGRDMTVPGIEPRADGELGRFADFAAALAAKDAEVAKWKAIAAEGRKAGREEALSILLAENAEEPFDAEIRSYAIGDTGEYGTEWDEAALRKKFDVEPGATKSALERADEFYWSTREEVDRLRAEVPAAVEMDRLRILLALNTLREVEETHHGNGGYGLGLAQAVVKARSSPAVDALAVVRKFLAATDEAGVDLETQRQAWNDLRALVEPARTTEDSVEVQS